MWQSAAPGGRGKVGFLCCWDGVGIVAASMPQTWRREETMIGRFAPALAALGLLLAGPAVAQSYPTKPVRVIVPYVAGGAADIFGRTIAQKLSEAFRQQFVVENRGGANGGLGTDAVAKAAPDGYTLLITASGPITVNPVLYANVP